MLPKGHDEYKLLEAMGRETANVHVGSKRAAEKIKRDLNKRPAMVHATTEDWQAILEKRIPLFYNSNG